MFLLSCFYFNIFHLFLSEHAFAKLNHDKFTISGYRESMYQVGKALYDFNRRMSKEKDEERKKQGMKEQANIDLLCMPSTSKVHEKAPLIDHEKDKTSDHEEEFLSKMVQDSVVFMF